MEHVALREHDASLVTLTVASSAGRYGLTEVKVLDPDAVLPRALDLAARLAAFPPDTYARTKRELRGANAERLRAAAAEDPLLTHWIDREETG
jgi:enoyl-CoA hydratase/carnithine racemase